MQYTRLTKAQSATIARQNAEMLALSRLRRTQHLIARLMAKVLA